MEAFGKRIFNLNTVNLHDARTLPEERALR